MGAARARRGRGAAANAVSRFLDALVPAEARGDRELAGTARRVAQAFEEDLLDGYRSDPARLLAGGIPHGGRDLVAVTGIDFHSVCPHHLLPYRGVATVAYVPGGKVVGFGVLARLVDCFAHRLVIEERLARQVVEALVGHLGARGAACVLDAEQLCMTVRGETRRGARAHTEAFAGTMEADPALQRRVLDLARGAAAAPRPGPAPPAPSRSDAGRRPRPPGARPRRRP
jgi:GTP cyclohydrolase I